STSSQRRRRRRGSSLSYSSSSYWDIGNPLVVCRGSEVQRLRCRFGILFAPIKYRASPAVGACAEPDHSRGCLIIPTRLVESLLSKPARAPASRRFPEATYRLQFHAGFTFRDAAALVPYLHDLGVSDLYASPYLQARPGSKHGYDISNHGALNS